MIGMFAWASTQPTSMPAVPLPAALVALVAVGVWWDADAFTVPLRSGHLTVPFSTMVISPGFLVWDPVQWTAVAVLTEVLVTARAGSGEVRLERAATNVTMEIVGGLVFASFFAAFGAVTSRPDLWWGLVVVAVFGSRTLVHSVCMSLVIAMDGARDIYGEMFSQFVRPGTLLAFGSPAALGLVVAWAHEANPAAVTFVVPLLLLLVQTVASDHRVSEAHDERAWLASLAAASMGTGPTTASLRSALTLVADRFGGHATVVLSDRSSGDAPVLFDGTPTPLATAALPTGDDAAVTVLGAGDRDRLARALDLPPGQTAIAGMMAAEGLAGWLVVTRESFKPTDLTLVTEAARVVSVLFRLDEMTRAIRRLAEDASAARAVATRCALTGLANRRGFDDHVTTGAWTIAMIDLDRFKPVNDTYGHAVGDQLLVELASRLDDVARRFGGVAARCGGDEFTVAAPLCDPGALGDELVRVVGIPVCLTDGRPAVTVGASVGLASGTVTGPASRSALVAAADRAMYEAKRSGRSRWAAAGTAHTTA